MVCSVIWLLLIMPSTCQQPQPQIQRREGKCYMLMLGRYVLNIGFCPTIKNLYLIGRKWSATAQHIQNVQMAVHWLHSIIQSMYNMGNTVFHNGSYSFLLMRTAAEVIVQINIRNVETWMESYIPLSGAHTYLKSVSLMNEMIILLRWNAHWQRVSLDLFLVHQGFTYPEDVDCSSPAPPLTFLLQPPPEP